MSTPPARYPSDSLLATEIAQQTALWPTTLERVKGFLATHPGVPTGATGVMFTGAGTSAYAGSAVIEAWPSAVAIPTTDLLLQPVEEIRATHPGFVEGGMLISLARSGDSPESAAVVEKFQRNFPAVKQLAIVCNANGRLAKLPGVEAICLDPRTNDRSLAMTGSFSNLVLGGLALLQGREIEAELAAICRRVDKALIDQNATLEEIARATRDRVVILASGMQALCREVALKIVELTAGNVMAMPETFLGFRHGAVGFLREDTPILCYLSSDPQKRRYEEDVLKDLRSKGLGRLVIVGGENIAIGAREWCIPAVAADLPDGLRTPFEIVLAQLLAYQLSVAVNVDPDNPSPDGTITRVVKPFRIHTDVV